MKRRKNDGVRQIYNIQREIERKEEIKYIFRKKRLRITENKRNEKKERERVRKKKENVHESERK